MKNLIKILTGYKFWNGCIMVMGLTLGGLGIYNIAKGDLKKRQKEFNFG